MGSSNGCSHLLPSSARYGRNDRNGASAVLRNRSVLGGSIASASGAGSEGPADPVAQGLPHDEVEVAALQPRQFLGEQGHALPPGARHAGDVRAPEHPLGTERVETAVQMRMQTAERIFVLGVARPVALTATFGYFASASNSGWNGSAASPLLARGTPIRSTISF